MRESNPQHYCAFLALVGPDDDLRFDAALERLPRAHGDGWEIRRAGLRLAWFPGQASPLHRTLVIEERGRYLLLQGDFYRPLPETELRVILETATLDLADLGSVLERLSGSFSGIVALPETQTLLVFSDQFSFSFAYYASEDERIWASSSLWPMLRIAPSGGMIDQASVEEIVLLGYPTGERTILAGVSMVQPGRVVAVGPHELRVHRYAVPPTRREQSERQALDRFRDVFQAHFAHVVGQVGRDQVVTTITGGHDTRVVLNAALAYGIHPMCVTGSDDPNRATADAMRAMRVAAVAECARAIIPYTQPHGDYGADAYLLSEGGGTGIWMATLASASRRYGRVLYCGFSGDVLSGSPETVNPALHRSLDSLGRAVFMANYEYQTPPELLASTLFGQHLDQILARYTETFALYQGLDPHDICLHQNLDNRNMRRIAYFSAAIKRFMPSVSLYHDRDVARTYLELPYELLRDERIHRRLCSLASPALNRIPTNQWMVPMPLEPLFWNYVRGPAKRAYPTVLALRARLRGANQPRAVAETLDPRYVPMLELIERANILDPDRIRQICAAEPFGGRGHLLAFRLELLAKLVIAARGGELAEFQSTNLFPEMTLRSARR